jgi:hypothetical protein
MLSRKRSRPSCACALPNILRLSLRTLIPTSMLQDLKGKKSLAWRIDCTLHLTRKRAKTSVVNLIVKFVRYYTSHFSVWTNGRKRNISYSFSIGRHRGALYPWVWNLHLWDSGSKIIPISDLIESIPAEVQCPVFAILCKFKDIYSIEAVWLNVVCRNHAIRGIIAQKKNQWIVKEGRPSTIP